MIIHVKSEYKYDDGDICDESFHWNTAVDDYQFKECTDSECVRLKCEIEVFDQIVDMVYGKKNTWTHEYYQEFNRLLEKMFSGS